MIHPSTIEEIKNRIDIVEVIEDFIPLKRSGSSYKALSPFTNEKTPSFYVVPSKEIFKDFSSGKGGDAITFVMEVDGLSYVDSLKYLAKKYGFEIKEDDQSDEEQQAQNIRESLYIVLNFAKKYFQEILHDSEEGKAIGLTYFKERDFTNEVINKFELGYSKELWDGLLNEAVKKGYNKDILEKAGLIIAKEGKTYDRFRSRVMFPIHNISGKVIAFGGRILSRTDKSAKYINSPETELYHKSSVLYGMYQGKTAIRKEANCYLVEGYTDVISMHQAGIENVISSSGTSLTEDQVKLIRRYSENVTIIFDGDQAGISASMRGIDLLLEADLNVKAVALPEGEDPDSHAKKIGADNFKIFIVQEAQDIIRFKTAILLKETGNDPIKKAEVIRDIVSSITKISDPVKRNVYIQECSKLLDIPEYVLISEQNKILIENRKKKRNTTSSQDEIQKRPISIETTLDDPFDIEKIIEHQEKESIRLLFNYGKNKISATNSEDEYLITYLIHEVEEINYSHPVYKRIIRLYKERLGQGEIVEFDELMNAEDKEIKEAVIDLTLSKFEVSENWYKKHQIHVSHESEFLKDATYNHIVRLKHRVVKKMTKEINQKLEKETDLMKMDELMDNINEFNNISRELSQILGMVINA